MNEITINGRTITVTHVSTETSEYGDIQRYRIDVSNSDATAHLSRLSPEKHVNVRVMASIRRPSRTSDRRAPQPLVSLSSRSNARQRSRSRSLIGSSGSAVASSRSRATSASIRSRL